MVRSTIIVRASDALPLAASVDDEQVWPTSQWSLVRAHNRTDGASSSGAQAAVQTYLSTHNTQLGASVLNREWRIYAAVRTVSIVFSPMTLLLHSYLIVDNVVFLTIADKSYPRKLAFSYLDELSKEFATTYGAKVEAVRKPYAFVGFGTQFLSLH